MTSPYLQAAKLVEERCRFLIKLDNGDGGDIQQQTTQHLRMEKQASEKEYISNKSKLKGKLKPLGLRRPVTNVAKGKTVDKQNRIREWVSKYR